MDDLEQNCDSAEMDSIQSDGVESPGDVLSAEVDEEVQEHEEVEEQHSEPDTPENEEIHEDSINSSEHWNQEEEIEDVAHAGEEEGPEFDIGGESEIQQEAVDDDEHPQQHDETAVSEAEESIVAEEFHQGVVEDVAETYESQEEFVNQEDVTQEVEVPIQEDFDNTPKDIVEYSSPQDSNHGEIEAKDDHDKNSPVQDDEDSREQNQGIAAESRNEESEEDDFDNVVEVEEQKAEGGDEDDNVAQHVSDSEEEDEGKMEEIKLGDVSEDDLRGASSGSENDESDVEDSNISSLKKRTGVLSSDEDDDAEKEKLTREKHEAALKMFDTDSEDEEKEGVGDLIADIFGESDDEGEEFTGFGAEEVGKKKSVKAKGPAVSDSDEDGDEFKQSKVSEKSKVEEESDSDEGVKEGSTPGMSDFDIMLAKKKEENRKHRRRRDNSTFITDADDIINAMLTKMKEAAETDRDANQHRKPALKKLKMLPTVISHLKKQNLKELFVDNGVIAAIADWLSLLPDRSLPHITIRTELLKVLHDLPSVGPETLKHSGIGKAVMIIFKHPKEARQNRDSAGRLINKWSRPIFGLNENFKSMSREEREQRDLEQMPQAKRRKLTVGVHDSQAESQAENELGHLRPGEAGFVMRARVPMPSTKDYVVRPKWNVEVDDGRDDEDDDTPSKISRRRRSAGAPRSSKKDERLEKHMKNFAERRKNSKMQRAVNISIEGNKMSIL